ncbi:SAV_2336 N-terminal domain-related protein [Streptomyces sp. NPDC006997]|uniref:SAV_2336 N-terminal domain-related protein n=1 Tax=Streptomyces sp. NPDC006997 TaxID=3155356 RepID=UPI0033F55B24
MNTETAQTDGPDGPDGPRPWVMARALRRPAWVAPDTSPAAALLVERRIAAALQPLLPEPTGPPAAGAAPPEVGWPSWPSAPGPAWQAEERPAAEPAAWDITVVADGGLSMEFWRPVAEELVALLRRVGLCRQESIPTLDTESTPPEADVRLPDDDGTGPASRPVLLLTDGLAGAWRTSAVLPRLHAWALRSPVVVVHLLPEKLWPSSALVPRLRALRSPLVGAPAADVDCEGAPPGTVAVPVLALREDHVHRWARFLARGPEGWSNLPTVLVSADAPGTSRAPDRPGGQAATAQDLLRDFASASPDAQTLATRLSGVPLNLPVMRRTQSRVLPGSAPDLLSEILIAGLLVPVVDRADIRSHDRVTFDFPAGVRELLLAALHKSTTAETFRDAVHFLEHDLGVPEVQGWDRLPRAPQAVETGPVTERSEPFLRVQLAVLKALSGQPYEAHARRLEGELARWSAGDGA